MRHGRLFGSALLCVLGGAPAACGGLAAGPAASPPAAEASRPVHELPANIRVNGGDSFQRRTLELLSRLSKTRSGARLLRRLAASGKAVSIREGTLERSGAVMMPLARGESVLVFDPSAVLPGLPPLVVLHHELVHALFWAEGRRLPDKAEEERALGIGEHARLDLSENALRRDLGLPPRAAHALPTGASPAVPD